MSMHLQLFNIWPTWTGHICQQYSYKCNIMNMTVVILSSSLATVLPVLLSSTVLNGPWGPGWGLLRGLLCPYVYQLYPGCCRLSRPGARGRLYAITCLVLNCCSHVLGLNLVLIFRYISLEEKKDLLQARS